MVLTLVIAPSLFIQIAIAEVKRIDILLNRTREDYATKDELRDDIDRVLEALHRVEDKLDRVLSKMNRHFHGSTFNRPWCLRRVEGRG